MLFFIPSLSVAKRLYPRIFLSAQDHGEMERPRRIRRLRGLEKLLDRLPWPSKPALAFLEKDLKTFAQ